MLGKPSTVSRADGVVSMEDRKSTSESDKTDGVKTKAYGGLRCRLTCIGQSQGPEGQHVERPTLWRHVEPRVMVVGREWGNELSAS